MKAIRTMAILAALLASGLATAKPRNDAERLALIEPHAGEAVPSARLIRTYSWESLGSERMLLWDTPSRAYLLKLDGFCSDLPTAMAISLRYQSPRLSAGFDRVVVRNGSLMSPQECRILEIRPVDVKAMRTAERQARAAKREARAASKP